MKKILFLFIALFMLKTAMIVSIIPVEAQGTIYIMADGSVVGTTDISSADNITYTFTGNIYDEIVVERDNIVVDGAGYTLESPWTPPVYGNGIDLTGRSNVTIKNMEVKSFLYGILLNSSNSNTISGNNITNNAIYGILLNHSSNHNTISGNNITNSISCGISVSGSSSNTISGNNITNNEYGIKLDSSNYNNICHNNFVDNTEQAYSYGSTNVWDDGYPSGGNYWSDYPNVDLLGGPYQNETGSDGIGDTPYTIDVNNQDNYPLMGMFSDFSATLEYHVQTICNSSIADSQFNGTAICFNVTGENGTTGFCRICIPRALMNETYKVFVNGTEVPCNLLPCSNTTHSYLYFTYNLSTQEVIVIPEFPAWTSMLLLLIGLTVALAICKRKLLKTPVN